MLRVNNLIGFGVRGARSFVWNPVQRSMPVSAFFEAVTFGNGVFAAIASAASSVAATSPDGITWTQRTMPLSARWKSIAASSSVFVALTDASAIAATLN